MAMNTFADSGADGGGPAMVEGIARVIAADSRQAWLEPETTTSCGGCAAAGACGAKGIGTVASRLEARRFTLANDAGLVAGERVVVGVAEDALVKGSLTIYALPLVTMLAAGVGAQSLAGRDGISLAAMAAGLALGLGLARVGARRLAARGATAPRFLRRAAAGETCHAE